MAIIFGMLCLNCEKATARLESHYCSQKCSDAFLAKKDGPVDCAYCSASCDTVAEAKRRRWKEIQPDPEGILANYTGVCPPCWKEHC